MREVAARRIASTHATANGLPARAMRSHDLYQSVPRRSSRCAKSLGSRLVWCCSHSRNVNSIQRARAADADTDTARDR